MTYHRWRDIRDSRVASAAPAARGVQQPEPCNFVAPVDLDGDAATVAPHRSRRAADRGGGARAVRRVVVAGGVVMASALSTMRSLWQRFLPLALLFAGCAQTQPPAAPQYRPWAYDHATITVPPSAPPCALWTVREAWDVLSPGPAVAIATGYAKSPADGEIVVNWSRPAPPNLGLAHLYGDQPTWQKSRYVTRAVVQINECSVRLASHELAHIRGLLNTDAPGHLMHGYFPAGGWLLTPIERAILASTAHR